MKKTILILSAIALSSLGGVLNAQQIPTQDLVVEYKFDNNDLIETSGSTYNAGDLTSSGTVSYVQGIETATSAISPDGASLSNVGNITFSGNVKEYVVSFWFKANQETGTFKLLELKDPGSSNGLTIHVLNNTDNTSKLLVSQVSSGESPAGWYNSFGSYLDNEWHHFAVKLVYWTAGGKYYLRTYLDDVEVMDRQYQVSLSDIWVFGGLDIYLPSQATGNGTSQDLKIDNFRFYEFPITQTDITALYNEKNVSSSCANIVNIPDANFKTALLEHGTIITGPGISPIDTDGDGEICESEAQVYTGSINVQNKGVSDLTGIEAFTALTRLNCSRNQITNLNITANTDLEYLDCEYNQLTNLDLSTNTNLEYLRCVNNQLTQLDISGNTSLRSLNCSINSQLTSLNVANGNNNNMVRMIANSCPNLTCIQHDAGYTPTPFSQGNGWLKDETASWSENCNSSCANIVNIPDANFKGALLQHGTGGLFAGTGVIDTDGDGEICETEAQAYTGSIFLPGIGVSDLTGIEAFTSLTVLDCPSNLLTNIDLSSNTALTWVSCRNNQLTSLDVSANTALTYLECNGNNLTSLNVANGNNSNITTMKSESNPSLTCIQHDSGFDPTTNSGWTKDATASWSENCGTAGLEDFESALNISIYPNPTNGDFSIDLGRNIEQLEIHISDVSGKIVYAKSYENSQEVTLNLNESPGLYFVTILADGVQSKYKLIKK